MAEQQGASLNPSDMLAGGRVQDGRYTIKAATTEEFDYGGKSSKGAVPAACLVFKSPDGTEHEQYYSAGDLQYLVPSEDKSQFVHPRGETPKLSQNTSFGKFIKALVNAGFPVAELTAKVACLVGADVELVGQAQPKVAGSEKESVLVLPTKYYGRAKAGAAKPATRPTAARTAPAAATTATSAAPAASATAVNGDLDADAIIAVQEALATAPDTKLTVPRLGTAVMLTLAKAKNPNAQAIRKMLTADWLTAHMDEGNWVVDGADIALAS